MAYYLLVVDTEQYSGNFEREMCAYITGQIGDCGVGEEFVNEYSSDIRHLDWWNENVYQKADEHECERPVEIYPTEGWLNNGMGTFIKKTDPEQTGYPAYMSVAIFMTEKPSEEVIMEFVQRAQDFCTHYPELSKNVGLTFNTKSLTFTGVRFLKGIKKEELLESFLPVSID